MDRKCGDTNYEEVNMDMSDSDGSDNEMFACKQEYNSFKQHFNNKTSKAKPSSEYGGGGDNKAGQSVSEYGGDDTRVAVVSNKFGHGAGGGGGNGHHGAGAGGGNGHHGGGGGSYGHHGGGSAPEGGYDRNKRGGMREGQRGGGSKVESQPVVYGGKQGRERTKSRERRRSRSGDRKRRSRSREGRHGGRSRSRERRRSRSRERSPRRDGGRGRGGWGRDRDRGRRDRDEQARNMEEQVKKAKEMGVEMPKYFKPGAVNPLSYAEQVQKRKLMWSKPAGAAAGGGGVQGVVGAGGAGGGADVAAGQVSQAPRQQPQPGGKKTSFNNWEATNFGDETANEKFRRLMGIKSAPSEAANVPAPHVNQDKIKEDLEKNYEVARQQTHRNRGLGLGFSNLEPSMPEQYVPTPPILNPYLTPQPRPTPGGVWPNRPAAGNMNFVRKHN